MTDTKHIEFFMIGVIGIGFVRDKHKEELGL